MWNVATWFVDGREGCVHGCAWVWVASVSEHGDVVVVVAKRVEGSELGMKPL